MIGANGHGAPQPQTTPVDHGNPLLAQQPYMVTTSDIPTPGGQMLVVTFRSTSTTFTVLLTREEGIAWGRAIAAAAEAISPLVIPPGGLGGLGLPPGGLS